MTEAGTSAFEIFSTAHWGIRVLCSDTIGTVQESLGNRDWNRGSVSILQSGELVGTLNLTVWRPELVDTVASRGLQVLNFRAFTLFGN